MFKESFKKYKRKCPAPDLSEVLDFRYITSAQARKFEGKCSESCVHFCGLKDASQWKVSVLENHPGLLHVTNPFTPIGHRYWICRSLTSYTRHPHCRLNLDAFEDLKEGEDWWEISKQKTERAKRLQYGLRWSTLGYHHNWDTKVYDEDARDPFPGDLGMLSRCVARSLGFTNFEAQAAIVNFYHQGSTLAGHTDHSENNLSAPLLSFSFGCSAIFLLGGQSPAIKPTAMFLHSGDLVVMSEETRLSYHGVPKILPSAEDDTNLTSEISQPCSECSSFLDNSLYTQCLDNAYWKPFQEYILSSRINLNIRQVLNPDQLRLSD